MYNKEKAKQYYLKNKERLRKQQDNRYFANHEKQLEVNKQWYQENRGYFKKWYRENKIHANEVSRGYYQTNKSAIQKKFKKWMHSNPSIRIGCSQRMRIRRCLNAHIERKEIQELVGCSMDQLKEHLERQFTEGMTWDNYGFYGWHIDHIIPCVSFDLTDIEQQKKCFHYTNLQPLWAKDNLSKGSRVVQGDVKDEQKNETKSV